MTEITDRLTGYVKWFNSKTGYGFITILGEERDIFVHYSNVKVEGLQYTYLIQGEYVEFDLVATSGEDNKHSHQAVNITGIKGGPIMCKTRFQNRQYSQGESESVEANDSQPARRQRETTRVSVRPPRLMRTPTLRGDDSGDFKTVVRKRPVRKVSL